MATLSHQLVYHLLPFKRLIVKWKRIKTRKSQNQYQTDSRHSHVNCSVYYILF